MNIMSTNHKIGLGEVVDHRPYLIPGYMHYFRAEFLDPYVYVLLDYPGVEGIPPGNETPFETAGIFDEDIEPMVHQLVVNAVILNFGKESSPFFKVDDKGISMETRFNGVKANIYIPVKAVVLIKESTQRFNNQFNHVLGYGNVASKKFLGALPPEAIKAIGIAKPDYPNSSVPAAEEQAEPTRKEPFLRRVK